MPISECSVCGKAANDRCMKGCRECAAPLCGDCARQTNFVCFSCSYEPDYSD